MVKLRCRILKNNPKEPFMSIVNTLALEDWRYQQICENNALIPSA